MRRAQLVVALALLQPSCGGSTLQPVQNAIVRLVNTPNVTVDLTNDRSLAIGVDDSPLRGLPADEKYRRALEIATTGYMTYGFRATLQRVDIVFPDRTGGGDRLSFRPSQLVATTTAFTDWRPAQPPVGPLYMVEIGERADDLVEALASYVRARFSIPVTVLPRLSFDRITYDNGRGQIVADELINAIRQRYSSIVRQSTTRLIGVTSYDMYTTKANWVFTFSLRDSEDRIAVVSFSRMDPVFFGNAPDDELLRSRLQKMVTKNIGILCYGLRQSANPSSVLYGSIGGTDELDVMTEDFAPLGHLE